MYGVSVITYSSFHMEFQLLLKKNKPKQTICKTRVFGPCLMLIKQAFLEAVVIDILLMNATVCQIRVIKSLRSWIVKNNHVHIKYLLIDM